MSFTMWSKIKIGPPKGDLLFVFSPMVSRIRTEKGSGEIAWQFSPWRSTRTDGFVGEVAQSGFDGDSYPGSQLELAQN